MSSQSQSLTKENREKFRFELKLNPSLMKWQYSNNILLFCLEVRMVRMVQLTEDLQRKSKQLQSNNLGNQLLIRSQ